MELLSYLNSIPRYTVEELIDKEIAINCITVEEFNEVQKQLKEYFNNIGLNIRITHEVNYIKNHQKETCICIVKNEWREHELAAFNKTTDLVVEYDRIDYFKYTLHYKIIRAGDVIYE